MSQHITQMLAAESLHFNMRSNRKNIHQLDMSGDCTLLQIKVKLVSSQRLSSFDIDCSEFSVAILPFLRHKVKSLAGS